MFGSTRVPKLPFEILWSQGLIQTKLLRMIYGIWMIRRTRNTVSVYLFESTNRKKVGQEQWKNKQASSVVDITVAY